MNDDFLDHLFSAFGHLNRASQRKKEERSAKRGAREEGRRIKRAAFDEAPSAPTPTPTPTPAGKDPSCCTAKR